MSSSYFGLIRRLKDANVYARELAKQFALFRSVSDQVDNPRFKAFSRLKNYRLILKENPSIGQAPAGQWKPFVPSEGQPRPPPPEQPTPPPPPAVFASKFIYPPSSITVSSNDQSIAGYTGPGGMNDNNLQTAWGATTDSAPQWVVVDLGLSKQIHYLAIRWARHHQSDKTWNYNIETSPDNSIWTTKHTGSQFIAAGQGIVTQATLPKHDARYVRLNITSVTNHSGPANFKIGITELEIWGLAAGTPPPPPVPPGAPPPPGGPIQDAKFSIPNSAITAIGAQSPNVATNVNDGSLSTRWSYEGLPAWIRFDLGEVKRIAYVRIAWHLGDQRTLGYSIETSNSSGSGYTVRKTGSSSGTSTGFETYDFTDINAQFVQIRVTSTTHTAPWASISEIEIWGGDVQTSTPPPPGPPGSPPPPGPTPPPPPSTPTPQGEAHMMLNFNNTINDESGMQNHALMDGGTMRFAPGATSALGNSIDLNPLNANSGSIPPLKTQRMKDFGGPMFNKYEVEIWHIYWGSGWNNTSCPHWYSGTVNGPATISKVADMWDKVCKSDYWAGMWSYRWTKKPKTGGSVVHTATPLTAGGADTTPGRVTFAGIAQAVAQAMADGQVPNANEFAEPTVNANGPGYGLADFKHMYIVHVDPRVRMPAGFVGAAQMYATWAETELTTTGYYFMCSMEMWNDVALSAHGFGGTGSQNKVGIICHEIMHNLSNPSKSCSQGVGGFGYNPSYQLQSGQTQNTAFCGFGINHTECDIQSRALQGFTAADGTAIIVPRYWSDLDGKCIAPGTGDVWTRPTGSGPVASETYEKLWVPFSNTTQIIHNTNPGFSVFCRIYPYTVAPVANTMASIHTEEPIPMAHNPKIKYHGGAVFSKYRPQIYNIFWGSEWNSTSVDPWYTGSNVNALAMRNELTSAFTQIYASDHWKGLWQYGNNHIQMPIHGGNIVYTGTALPSGQLVTRTQVENCLRAVQNAGLVPHPDNFRESTAINGGGGFGRFDYQHIYILWIPPNKRLELTSSGYAFRATTSSNTCWFAYSTINIYPTGSSGVNNIDFAEGTWTHEIIHNLTSPGQGCTQGIGGYMYSESGGTNCTPLNHTIPGVQNCYGSGGSINSRPLTGTDAYVDWYWSDLDHKCIAPGTGESWTRPPTTPPPSPVPPPPGMPPAPPSPPSLPPPPPGTPTSGLRCIWIKQDDKNNGAQLLLGSDGTLYFNVKKDNIRYKIRTNPGVCIANTWHQIWCTFNKQTNAIDIYIDNVRYSNPSTVSEMWNDRHSHFIIGNYDTGSAIAPFRGRIDDFRLYRNGVVTSTNVQNMFTNQNTIETIPQDDDSAVAITGFIMIDEPLENDNFVVTNVVDPTILPPSPPPPPPPPPGTDDAPESFVEQPIEDIVEDTPVDDDDIFPPMPPASEPSTEEDQSLPEPIICDPFGEVAEFTEGEG